MVQRISPEQAKVLRYRASDLNRDGETEAAAEMAGAGVAYASRGLFELGRNVKLTPEGKRQDAQEKAQWTQEMHRAARTAGSYYEAASSSGPARLEHLLTASQYFHLASQTASNANDQARLERSAERCATRFERHITTLRGSEYESAVAQKVRFEAKLSQINPAEEGLDVMLDGLTTSDGPAKSRMVNCQRVVPATISSLAGQRYVSPSRDPSDKTSQGIPDIYKWAYGGKWESGAASEIRQKLLDAGPGTVAILQIRRQQGSGHVVALKNQDGVPLIVEGQGDRVEPLRPIAGDFAGERNAEYQILLIPSTGPGAVLKVDESLRAKEIHRLIDAPGARHGDFDARRRTMNLGPPESVRAAMTKLASTGYDGVPQINQALTNARALVSQLGVHSKNPKAALEAAKELNLPTKTWGVGKGMGLDNRVLVRMEADKLKRLRPVLAIGETNKPMLIVNIDGYSTSIDVESGRAMPLTPAAKDELTIIDVSARELTKSLDQKPLVAAPELAASRPTSGVFEIG